MTRKLSRLTLVIAFWVAILAGFSSVFAQKTYHIGSTTASDGEYYFDTLEDLRIATETTVDESKYKYNLFNGDRVILYKDDDSLTTEIGIADNARVEILSDDDTVQRTISIKPENTTLFFNMNRNSSTGSTLTLENLILMDGHQVGDSGGGAIHAWWHNNLTLKNTQFINNFAEDGVGGGAIYYWDALDCFIIDSDFLDNKTRGYGGALYINASSTLGQSDTTNVTLQVSDGKTSTFAGNLQGVGADGTGGTSNSIDFTGYSGNIVNFNIITGQDATLDMQDPFRTNEYTGGLYTVNITKTGLGTWKLGGVSTVAGSAGTTISIQAGVLEFYSDAALNAVGENDEFNISRGAEVVVNGGNTLTGTRVLFAAGSTLTFNMDFYHVEKNPLSQSMLYLAGDTLEVAGTYINVNNLPEGEDGYGNYILVQGRSALDAGDFTLRINGTVIDVTGAVSERFGYSLGNTDDATQLVLRVQGLKNSILRWQNYESGTGLGDQWSVYGKNWDLMYENPVEIDSYVYGDTVVFDLDGDHAITIGETVTIGPNAKPAGQADPDFYVDNRIGMEVGGSGNWTFYGQSITDAATEDDASRRAGLLFSGSGTLTLANTEANTYTGGTILSGGGTLRVARTDLLGTGDITFWNDLTSTLAFTDSVVFDRTISVGVNARGTVTAEAGADLTLTNADPGSVATIQGGSLTLLGNADNPIWVRGNEAEDGGAVRVGVGRDGNLEYAGTFEAVDVVFFGNSALGQEDPDGEDGDTVGGKGGAIHATRSNVRLKDSVFTYNTAAEEGGAIYYLGGTQGKLLIEATTGKTTSFFGNVAAGVANSIHVEALNEDRQDAAVEIRTAADGSVDMFDPMTGYAETGRAINITKTGDGTWNLAGRSTFTADGSGKTILTVSEGILALYRAGEGVEAGKLDITGTLAIGAAGTLLANGGNEITATKIQLESGATLAFDMTDIEADNTAFLDLRAGSWETGSWNQNIDLKNYVYTKITDDSKITYNLFTLDADTVAVDNMTLLYRGTEMDSLRENFGRLKVTNLVDGKLLSVDISKPHTGVTVWDPINNRNWNAVDQNWNGTDLGTDDITGSTQFLHGDAVFFGDNGAGDVRIGTGGVEIARHNDDYRGLTIDNSGGNTYTFSGGAIEGGGGLLKRGDGSVVLMNSNTFEGGTTIEAGEVVAQKTDSLGKGNVAIAAAGTLRLDIAEGSDGVFANVVGGDGGVVKSEYGTVKLTGKNSYRGGTDILGGGVILGNVDAAGTGPVALGDRTTLTFEDVIGSGTRPADFANLISGTGTVRATGKTNLLLSGENTYTGGTQVEHGATITIKNLSAAGTGNFDVDGTFIFDFSTNTSIVGRTISGNGVLRKTGSGTLDLSTANNFQGTTRLIEGTLRMVDAQALKNSTLDYVGGTFSFGANIDVALGGLAGERNLVLQNENYETVHLTIGSNASDQTYGGILSGEGSLTKVGRGTQTFTRSNTYSGGTTISGGRVVAVGVDALGTGTVVNDSELEFEIRGTTAQTYDKIISGTGSLIKSGTGTLALTADNSYENGTVVDAGTLEIDSLRAVGMHLTPTSDRTGTVTLNDDATLVLNIDADPTDGDEHTVTRNIAGAGTFVKDGNGTLTIARDLTFTGNIDVAAGTLFLHGKTGSAITVRGGAALSGTGTVNNTLWFENGSTHRVGYSDVDRLGTFTANNLQYDAGSTIYLKIGRNGSDQVVAKGGIDFASGGGVVNVVLLNLGAVDTGEIETARSYEIFSAEGGLIRINGGYVGSGTSGDDFLTLNGVDGVRFQADADQDIVILGHSVQSTGNLSKGIYLDLYLTGSGLGVSSDGLASSLTSNQLEVFAGIGDASVYDRILSYGKSDRGDVIDRLTPMIQTAMPYLTQRSVTQFNTALFQRLRFRRQAFLEPGADDGTARGQERRFGRCLDGRNDLWFQNYGDFIRMSSGVQRPNFQADTYGFNMGFDRDFHHRMTLGLGFGGYFSEVRANDYNQKGNVDAFLISAYGDWRDDCTVFSASTGLVAARYSLERSVTSFDTLLESEHDGTTFFISGELSRKSYWGACELTPFAGVDLIWMWEDAYREKAKKGDDAIALHVKKDYNASILGNVGLRIGRTLRLLGGNVVSPSVYAAWIHDYNKGRIHSTAGFAGQPMFTIAGASMYRDRAKVGANVDMTINHRMDMFGRFDAEFSHGMNSLTFHWGIQMGF